MTRKQRQALERQIAVAQERHIRNWNRMIRKEEAQYAAMLDQIAKRRSSFRVIQGGAQ